MADLPYFSQFPQNASARVNLGIALASPNGHLEEGIAELTQGIDLAPQSANVHNGLGVALARAGRVEDAAIHVEKAVRLMPQSADCCYNLGREGLNCGSIGAGRAGAKLTGPREPAILEMLAATYCNTRLLIAGRRKRTANRS